MQKFTQNRYVQAALVAFVTGGIAACTVYAGTMTDGLDMRHTVKVVVLAFLAPFSILVSVLPKITDIITPTVRIVSQEQVVKLAQAAPERTIITTEPETTVAIGDSLADTMATTPYRRTREGNRVPVKAPPVKLT